MGGNDASYLRAYDRRRYAPAKMLLLADGGCSSAGERLNITVILIVFHSSTALRGACSSGSIYSLLGFATTGGGVSTAADLEGCYEIKKGTISGDHSKEDLLQTQKHLYISLFSNNIWSH